VANRPLDLAQIDAVGFDLDHTLALYDDHAVNALAMAEAQELLVAHRGYRPGDVAVNPQRGDFEAARALALDLASAHVVKLDGDRRVRVARRGGVWADRWAHREALPEARNRVHPLSSPFDVPTMWLFEALTRAHADSGNTADFDCVRACLDARQMLDRSHTVGELKSHLARDLARYVSAVEGAAARLDHWRRAGKTLFVVTNSELDYAMRVLDFTMGAQWRSLFAVVSTSSAKPRFFEPSGSDTRTRHGARDAAVLEGAHADEIEARVGARGARILYVGDNAHSDIVAARNYGWKTVHVVAELAHDPVACERWGTPFAAGDQPSWFARVVAETADAVCDRVDRLLACEPDERIDGPKSA
jgi:HAD superfamily 5'-nucleotidase-like hydrolase